MMTKQDQDKLKHLKSEINQQKSHLLQIASRISDISPKQGDQLYNIIAKLESWQNK